MKLTDTQSTFVKNFKANHPIGQDFHTGLYGYARIHDCLDLRFCTFKSEKSAQIARGKQAIVEASIEELYAAE